MNKIKLSELMVLLPILLLVAQAAPDARAQEAPICESLVRDSTAGTLTVTYSKTENTCAHLKDASSQITHVQNFFCSVGVSVAITQPLTSFGASVGKAELIDPLKLCNGNNANFCTECGPIQEVDQDADNDGVIDGLDVCSNTVIPESLPTRSLGVNRFALFDGDDVFDTTSPKGKGHRRSYTTADTAGCSCTQIIDALGLGNGHTKFGCSISAMDEWVILVNP